MEYLKFEEQVKSHVMYDAHWLYIIKNISPQHRQRYIDTLDKGINMPSSFDLILAYTHLSTDEYRNMLKEKTT